MLAGAIAGRMDLIAAVRLMHNVLGGTIDPHAAWLMLRGMKTLELRVQRHNASALALATRLEAHPKVGPAGHLRPVLRPLFRGQCWPPPSQLCKLRRVLMGRVLPFADPARALPGAGEPPRPRDRGRADERLWRRG